MSSSAQEQNKEVVRQCVGAWDRHDTERMEGIISSSNYSFRSPGMSTIDWNAAKQFLTALWSAFPDLSHKIEEIMAEGDKVAIRVINTGTHKGEFLGIPPTYKKVSFVEVGFLTIRDGKIVEQWSINDTTGLMQQIGAIPPASSSAGSGGNTPRS
jgi:C-1 hydroxylase